MSGRGVATGLTEEDVNDQVLAAFANPLLQPWTVESPTVITYGDVILDSDPGFGSSFEVCNDTGADACFTQIGTNGSAFLRLQKALGTKAAPTQLLAGNKVGGLSYAPHDGTDYRDTAELSAHAVEDISATARGTELRVTVTEAGQTDRFTSVTFNDDGDVTLHDYPAARDDGWTDTALHTGDAAGSLQTGRILVPGQVVAFASFEDRLNDQNIFEAIGSVTLPGDTPAGQYELTAKALVSIDATGSDYEGRLLRGTVQQGATFRREGKDAAGVGTAVAADGDNSGTDQRVSMQLSVVRTFAANSTEVIRYEHRPTANGVEATCFDLIIEVRYMGP